MKAVGFEEAGQQTAVLLKYIVLSDIWMYISISTLQALRRNRLKLMTLKFKWLLLWKMCIKIPLTIINTVRIYCQIRKFLINKSYFLPLKDHSTFIESKLSQTTNSNLLSDFRKLSKEPVNIFCIPESKQYL